MSELTREIPGVCWIGRVAEGEPIGRAVEVERIFSYADEPWPYGSTSTRRVFTVLFRAVAATEGSQ